MSPENHANFQCQTTVVKISRLLNKSVFQQFFFNRREYIQFSKYPSYKSCVKHKLDVCKDTSRTPVKLSLNCARTEFYSCSATPVITSRSLEK